MAANYELFLSRPNFGNMLHNMFLRNNPALWAGLSIFLIFLKCVRT